MPELPEVETIVRGLRKQLIGLEFSESEVLLAKCVHGAEDSFCSSLRGRKILSLSRRGKNIIFHLSGGAALVIHLRMTGQLHIVPRHQPPDKHTHAVFFYKKYPYQLRFNDSRQFGRILLEEKGKGEGIPSLKKLGPEPLEISGREFVRRVQATRRMIKPLLLDQHFLAGVGNIYADESLHQARIHPRRNSATLSNQALLALYRTLRRILRAAIRSGGTSVRSYVDSAGSPGRFQNFLRVYQREGEPCRQCGANLVREPVGGRSSFFCPRCQPAPRMRKSRHRPNQKAFTTERTEATER
jgi:formamidopyrimidine-DNA glycosylase